MDLDFLDLFVAQILCDLCSIALLEPRTNELVKPLEEFRKELFIKNPKTCTSFEVYVGLS